MHEYLGKVAVVTGSADGIGLAIAERFCKLGMLVVLSDINKTKLDLEVTRLQALGYQVAGCVTDVSSSESMQNLADFSIKQFGKVNIVCNNAGRGGVTENLLWEATEEDWNYVLDTNVRGVINSIRSFVPLLMKTNEETHIINVASMVGLYRNTNIYSISKHAVVAISEALCHQLEGIEIPIQVSVLCPGHVKTDFPKNNAKRNINVADKVVTQGDRLQQKIKNFKLETRKTSLNGHLHNAITTDELVDLLIHGLEKNDFYIFPFALEEYPILGKFIKMFELK
jgi:NAD(P)-dependent dehydrogenase (short-subunit alcohol dehydrogenase family)